MSKKRKHDILEAEEIPAQAEIQPVESITVPEKPVIPGPAWKDDPKIKSALERFVPAASAKLFGGKP
jgi:hypothetical protein